MVDLITKEIALNGKTQGIVDFRVWWMTPMGLFDNLEEAQTRVKESDFDPRQMVVPVTVAIAADGTYEVLGR